MAIEAATKPRVPDEVRRFLNELTPGDTGSTVLGDWTICYEGFSADCIWDVEQRMALPEDDPRHAASLQDVLDEVMDEFQHRLGKDLVEVDTLGDEEQPIVYALGWTAPAPAADPEV
ncbi:hypothetical protein LAZ40_01525 [Cereibacter sphaeroides]|uniref:hypothetical protein n=1 Tax=Cereibacter sphaeroides TaxID=1063 RepID=UPI001F2CE261|nr:hypothetical protein [Cereibacter sphaeroides]MCE6957740.1 hypothetical protein [Cereibacter sphaeroides]MCE6971634.1 hypothetical protein [Cereibacter sphaeroides]